jgi:hypothetical protein
VRKARPDRLRDVGVLFSLKTPRGGVDQECNMSKGLDKKKEQKKKPAKSLEEKRAAKREKKESRG